MAPSNMSTGDFLEEIKALKEHDNAISTNMDQFFLITMAIVIYFMQCGFALLEAGSVRSKNTTNILIKNLLDTFIAGLAFWVLGFPLGQSKGNAFLGEEWWVSYGLPETEFAKWFFHFVFAATAATIVSGAVAERCDFVAYLVYSVVLTGFMYPVVVHWAWTSEGWLAQGMTYNISGEQVQVGYQDFAGSGVVHVLGGTAAFVAAYFLGPRIGRFDSQGNPQPIRGHSVPLAALGGFILIFGFFAFNGGSQASISQAGDGAAVGLSVTNTVISGSAAATVTLIFNRATGAHSWSLLSTLNGALAGMVAICAGCNVFHPWCAAVTGIFAAVNYTLWSWLNLNKFKVDDPLDAVAVHFGGGIWGLIAVPLMKKDKGLIYAWSTEAGYGIAWNLCGLIAIVAWTAIICIAVFGILKAANYLRVSEEVELKGLDIKKHNEPAYPTEAYGHGWDNSVDAVKEMIKDITLKHIEMSTMFKGDSLVQTAVNVGYEMSKENPEALTHATGSISALANTDVGNGTANSAYVPGESNGNAQDNTKL